MGREAQQGGGSVVGQHARHTQITTRVTHPFRKACVEYAEARGVGLSEMTRRLWAQALAEEE